MKSSQYSGYENYILMCDHSRGFKLGYHNFLNFKEVKKFVNQIANVSSDTFNYEGNIYNKKITSTQAQSMLQSIFHNRCDYSTFKIVATQLGVPI